MNKPKVIMEANRFESTIEMHGFKPIKLKAIYEPCYIKACRKRECILDHVWRWLNPFQLSSQPETINIINNIKGVMTMA
ncbi:MAG: hypothetical protein QXE61_04520 [Nitrososphaerota archaeon]